MCQHGLRKGAQAAGQLVDRLHERKRPDAAVVSPFALRNAPRAKPDNHLYKLVRVDINLLRMRGFRDIQAELQSRPRRARQDGTRSDR